MPPAPNGWTRINQIEVRNPELLVNLRQKWKNPEEFATQPLERDKGYKYLSDFVKYFADPDVEIKMK